MSKKKRKKKQNQTKWINERQRAEKEAAKERRRLKALPKPLQILETELDIYVDFEEVYDGYINDFTGQERPLEIVGNPFWILKQMGVELPDVKTLNSEQIKLYLSKIQDAFERMYFDFGFMPGDTEIEKQFYDLLQTCINDAENKIFGDTEKIKTGNSAVWVCRMERDGYYF